MDIRKFFCIFFTNISLFLILFFVADIYIYYSQLYISWRYEPTIDNISYIKHITRKLDKKYLDDIFFVKNVYPQEQNVNLNKQAFVLMGCSFTEGARLKQNFSYQLAEATNSPVYNRSTGGWGTQHMLYQLSRDKFYKIFKDKQAPPIFIYTYIDDHINRIHRAMAPVLFGGYPTFTYKEKKINNKSLLTIPKQNELIYRFPLLSLINEKLYCFKHQNEKATFLKLHLLQAKEEIEKRYQNPNFTIIIFSGDYYIYSIAKELQDNGINIISYEETTNLNLSSKNIDIFLEDGHPNEKAWKIFIPSLLDYLSLDEIKKKKKDKKTEEYINEKLNNYNINNYILDDLFNKYEPSIFSLAKSDDILKEEGKTTNFLASSAYISWAFSNLFKDIKIISVFFVNLSIKLNPNQEKYKQYKDFISSEQK